MGEHYALCDVVRTRLAKSLNRCLFPRALKGNTVVPMLRGDESGGGAEAWMRSYFSWAMQERLSDDQILLVALEHLDGKAQQAWGHFFAAGYKLQDFLLSLCKQLKIFCAELDTLSRPADVVSHITRAFAQMQQITCVRYSYRELAIATNIFSNSNLLGESEAGRLYEGRLSDMRTVAVRRLKKPECCAETTVKQLQREVQTLSMISHPNLIRLLGCCLEPDEPLLCFQYVPTGNLAQHLKGERGHGLDWDARLAIAIETAGALSHLHSACTPPLLHKSLKSSNVLLDEGIRPIVTGFGISKSMFGGNHRTGTPIGIKVMQSGYADPSYAQTCRFTEKSDVYAFGVVLMELVTGQQAVDFRRPPGEATLAAMAFAKKRSGDAVRGLLDPVLLTSDQTCVSTVDEVAELALKCMDLDVCMRPTVKEVWDQLRMAQDREIIRKKRGDGGSVYGALHSTDVGCRSRRTSGDEDGNQDVHALVSPGCTMK